MKIEEALQMLANAPKTNEPSVINPSFTRAHAVETIRNGILLYTDESELSDLFEKRVYQVCRNQINPRY